MTVAQRSIVAALVLAAAIPALLRSAPSGVDRSFKTWSQYLGGADSSQYSSLDQINKSTVSRLDVVVALSDGRYAELPLQSDRRGRHDVRAGEGQLDRRARPADRPREVGAPQQGRGRRSRDQLLGEPRPLRSPAALPERRLADRDRRADRRGDHRRSATRAAWTCASARAATARTCGPLQTNNPGRIYQDLFIISLPAGGAGYVANPGDVHAYDVRTGKLAWVFHTVPVRGEAGAETWPELGARHRQRRAQLGRAHGGRGARHRLHPYRARRATTSTAATATARTSTPTASLALDAKTGKRKWHFQTVHHDLWDYDLATAPKLLTVKHDGRDVDVVAQASKHGFLFVLERDYRPAAVADRGASGAAVGRAGRADLADAAVPDAAAAVRAAVVHREGHQPASYRAESQAKLRELLRQLGEQGALHPAEPAGLDPDAGQQRRRELGPLGRGPR